MRFEYVDECGRCSFMRAVRLSFLHMLKLIRQDRMLLAAGLCLVSAAVKAGALWFYGKRM